MNNEENIIEILKRNLVNSKIVDSEPKSIILGGLPGAGKTQLCNKMLQQNDGSQYVVIDVDDYRKYSPIFHNKNDNVSITDMVKLSSEFCNYVASELLEYALKGKKNIIINTSLRETNLMLNFIKHKFIPAGYNVCISVLAVSLNECILSAQERYEEQIENNEFPRFTPIDFIIDSETKIYETLQILENMGNTITLEVYKRGNNKNELPIEVYNNKEEIKKYDNAIDAIEACKKDENTKKNIMKQLSRAKNLYIKMKDRNATSKELEHMLKIIEYYKKN